MQYTIEHSLAINVAARRKQPSWAHWHQQIGIGGGQAEQHGGGQNEQGRNALGKWQQSSSAVLQDILVPGLNPPTYVHSRLVPAKLPAQVQVDKLVQQRLTLVWCKETNVPLGGGYLHY